MFNIDRDLGNSLYLAYKGMPPKTEKEALLLSVEKWEFVSKYYERGGKELLSDGGTSTCGCCTLFFKYTDRISCNDCPVYHKTGQKYCKATPYENYANAIELEEAHEYAKAELKFLQDLFKELYPNE